MEPAMTESQEISTGWVLAAIATVVATLSTTVAFLYRKLDANNSELIKELRDECHDLQEKSKACDDDRLILHKLVARLEAKVSILEDLVKEAHPKLRRDRPEE